MAHPPDRTLTLESTAPECEPALPLSLADDVVDSWASLLATALRGVQVYAAADWALMAAHGDRRQDTGPDVCSLAHDLLPRLNTAQRAAKCALSSVVSANWEKC